MRTGLTVVAVCLMISLYMGIRIKDQFKTDLVATQDLVIALMYFMEDHAGRFPDSEEEFRTEAYVETLSDGGVRIHAKRDSGYAQPQGYPIGDLGAYRILWGTDLAAVELDERSVARDSDDHRIELIRWPDSPKSGKGYTVLLLAESIKLRAGAVASSQPESP